MDSVKAPPKRISGILRQLGPGFIIAGSVVGSGELIATTKTGAEAGFWLLWLILIGCVIKVFVQIEMGRYSMVTGKTTMEGLCEVPGPRIPGHGNWIVWFWTLVFVATIGQVGGIVGAVGQALQISAPITESGRLFNRQVEVETAYAVAQGELRLARERSNQGFAAGTDRVEELQQEIARLEPIYINDRLAVADQELQVLRNDSAFDARAAEQLALMQAALTIVRRRIAEGSPPEVVFSDYTEDVVEGEQTSNQIKSLGQTIGVLGRRSSRNDELWAFIAAVITAIVLVMGRYGLIQSFAAGLVATFTLVTVANLVMLQSSPYWAVTSGDIVNGLSFRLLSPSADALGTTGIATALAAFGLIGVGANELIFYPYWCLEKGYAKFAGPRAKTQMWAERARGWMRVMRWDAWSSMVVYTFATIAFYLLGAAILGRTGLNPSGSDMIRTLGVMYEPVFGSMARWVFLFGAVAVLYSTFFVATASLARVIPDLLRILGFGPTTKTSYRRWVRAFSVIFPFACVLAYSLLRSPALMVLLGGVMQGVMLPMLAGAALYFRYRRSDARITPKLLWDVFLWLSAVGMLITGAWTAWSKLEPWLDSLM